MNRVAESIPLSISQPLHSTVYPWFSQPVFYTTTPECSQLRISKGGEKKGGFQ